MKKFLSVALLAATVCLVAAFVFFLYRDYVVYYPYGSAPFYVYVLERAVLFLLPAVILLILGVSMRKRGKRHEAEKLSDRGEE